MIVGITSTALAFVATILSIVAYYLYHVKKDEQLLTMGRLSFYTAGVLIVFQVVLLLTGILTHRFEWSYVFSYTSKDLPLYYLISTFWAGQEGTFLLWVFLGSIYGVVIIRSRKEDEPLVMSFMNLIQAFILLILIKKNPFTYVWEINPAGFPAGMVPMDGNGLNPLLQDPWMTIHPPVLFAGYSSTMILFSYAMAALIRRNYDSWVDRVFPYAIFVGLSLGAGIILGGYWAYTTLGWGGYWGWDPVENSSLIPWLTSLALIHGLIIQKRQGGMKRSNLLLALVTFILVLYGSFLTRSGILTDFSVHSFGASELSSYLIAFVLFFLGLGTLVYLFKIENVKGEKVQTNLMTRENFLFFGIIALLGVAGMTFIGTSSPLITGIFMDKASNVSIDYYNTIAGPAAILIAFLLALSPVLGWKRDSKDKVKDVIIHVVISLVLGVVIFILGMRDVVPLIVTVFALFVLLVNAQITVQMIRKKSRDFGGYLTHAGFALMIVGMVTSSVYDSSKKVTLPRDSAVEVMGYELVYKGKMDSPDGKDNVVISVNGSIDTHAKFYWSEYSQAYMVAPSVLNKPLHDLYISPIQIIPAGQNMPASDEIVLKKNEIIALGDYQLRFTGYDMNNHQMGGETMYIAAQVDVWKDDESEKEVIRPAIVVRGNDRDVQGVALPGTEREVFISGINVESQSISLAVAKESGSENPYEGKELLAVEVSRKPLISVLWLGTIILMAGFVVALLNRSNKNQT